MIYIFNGLWVYKERERGRRRVAARNYTKSNYNDKMSIDSLWLIRRRRRRRLEASNETLFLCDLVSANSK